MNFARFFVGRKAEILTPDKAHQQFVDEVVEERLRIADIPWERHAHESQRLEYAEVPIVIATSQHVAHGKMRAALP
jgi:hypothetical protein